MPFTLSHPAAALAIWPLVRCGVIPLAPFAVGAMSPDFEYLFRLEPLSLISHSARGLFVFCLPVGVVAWLLWEWLVRPVGRDLVALPADPPPKREGAYWGMGIVAVLLGSASHVGWDAFTHRYAWGTERFSFLRERAFTLLGVEVPWFNALQHLSTVVGGAIVLTWLWREVATARGGRSAMASALAEPRRLRMWAALGAVAMAVGAWNATGHGQMIHVRRAPLVIGRLAVGAMTGFAVALVALSAARRSRTIAVIGDSDTPGATRTTRDDDD